MEKEKIESYLKEHQQPVEQYQHLLTYLIWVLEGKENRGVGRRERTEIFEENVGQRFSQVMKT